MIYVTKDQDLAVPLIETMLKYWPFANCEKEQLFLTEFKEVLEFCNPS